MLKIDLSSFHVDIFIFFEISASVFDHCFLISLFEVVLDIKLWKQCKKEEGMGTDV